MDVPQITFSSEKKKPLKIGGLEYISTNDFSLTEKDIEKARKELYETEEKKFKKLKELIDKLANDSDANYRTDTPYLLRFLRVRKSDSSRAYQNISAGYIFKKKHPGIVNTENLEKLLNLNLFNYLPYADENGNTLFFLDTENWKLEDTSVEEVLKITSMVSEIITMNPKLQIYGVFGIWDVKGLSAQHIASLLGFLGPKEFSFYNQNMYPWRIKKVLILNTGRLTRLFFRMLRPFVSKKVYERIFLLGSDLKELHQHVNPVLLPKKLGGFLDEKEYSVASNILDNISYLKYDSSFT